MAHPEIPLVTAQEFAAVADGIAELFGQKAVERVFRDHGFSERIFSATPHRWEVHWVDKKRSTQILERTTRSH